MFEATYRAIGVIHTPFKEPKGTPIRPYVPEFDVREVESIGWLDRNVEKLPASRDDGRFIE